MSDDAEVENWVVIGNRRDNTSLSIDVAIIDLTGDSLPELLRRVGAGAEASKCEDFRE